ncbi:MAG: DUF1289 domain-containing protein [Comamonadaceae bacterium]|nr:DUF1289 domain-containing protein [Comamonadaceae bacterium]
MISPRAMLLLAASARLQRATSQNDSQSVASPCMSVCQMDEATGLCVGCLRTLDEIAQWGNADAAFKRGVWGRIEDRLVQIA